MKKAKPAINLRWQLTHEDCLAALPKLDANTIDAVITDPPYGIGFNSMTWDRPKYLDPTRSPQKRTHPNTVFQAFCTEWARSCLRALKPGGYLAVFAAPRTAHRLTCGIEEAGLEIRDTLMWLHGQGFPASRQLPRGRGTGLKPAYEPIILARRPLAGNLDRTLAEYGTGALNIDACRHRDKTGAPNGRWPANVILSHARQCSSGGCSSRCPAQLLDERHRFFYCAKANRRERDAGCEQLPKRTTQTFRCAKNRARARSRPVGNMHPTVKPIELMRWLVRLVTPSDGVVLDPFTGSGSTGAAAMLEGARFVGFEREADYIRIARARITHWATVAAIGQQSEEQPAAGPCRVLRQRPLVPGQA